MWSGLAEETKRVSVTTDHILLIEKWSILHYTDDI
jgi:hypothetical protein